MVYSYNIFVSKLEWHIIKNALAESKITPSEKFLLKESSLILNFTKKILKL